MPHRNQIFGEIPSDHSPEPLRLNQDYRNCQSAEDDEIPDACILQTLTEKEEDYGSDDGTFYASYSSDDHDEQDVDRPSGLARSRWRF